MMIPPNFAPGRRTLDGDGPERGNREGPGILPSIWPIEDHIAGDVLYRWPDIPGSRGFNHLPYRMLLPTGLDNLFVAGRCASMTHGGQSAARVTGGCFVMGEAAGTAAAMVVANGGTTRTVDVPRLQATLLAQGVYLGTDM
jgi:hypothetical protein